MMIASLNAQQLIMLARRKPSTITTSITKTLGLIDEGRRPMTTLRGIKEKGRRLDLLCLSLVRALYSKQNNKKKTSLGCVLGLGYWGEFYVWVLHSLFSCFLQFPNFMRDVMQAEDLSVRGSEMLFMPSHINISILLYCLFFFFFACGIAGRNRPPS